jgi:hypothetical protein
MLTVSTPACLPSSRTPALRSMRPTLCRRVLNQWLGRSSSMCLASRLCSASTARTVERRPSNYRRCVLWALAGQLLRRSLAMAAAMTDIGDLIERAERGDPAAGAELASRIKAAGPKVSKALGADTRPGGDWQAAAASTRRRGGDPMPARRSGARCNCCGCVGTGRLERPPLPAAKQIIKFRLDLLMVSFTPFVTQISIAICRACLT